MTPSTSITSRHGFTLIELSIVLIIIGLIIGGVLVGQDMIKGAEIRATIGQLEKYNSAVNTFRGKYGFIPGDEFNSQAQRYGFPVCAGVGGGMRDGDGLLESCNNNEKQLGCETAMFWNELGATGLIDGSYPLNVCARTDIGGNPARYVPKARLGNGNYILVYGSSGANYYQIAGFYDTNWAGALYHDNRMSPQQGFEIDSKLDDGMPQLGIVQARVDTGAGVTALDVAATPAAAAAGVCVENVNNTYNTATSVYANALACEVRVQFQ